MAMAKKHVDGGRIVTSGKVRAARCPTKVPNCHQGSPSQRSSPNKNGEPHLQRLSPVRVHSQSPQGSLGSSPRTSPGLLAGHYAGCKFSEPPLPSALPLPPQHWMQTTRSVRLPFHSTKSDHSDVAQQLKVLLKVQA
ncbi:hypothetical protein NQ314_002542 [Rhamnusium bicolor]|uniref:Proline-rich nuclear receptor coactivator 2 n=1 Tax=Rhamnusium bicolor TaxID=1586634 RepID=A0AAV8ZQ16_9CUCU|nr:hypothetical protein NQ314_002542 [Rhamnusium bicolor]